MHHCVYVPKECMHWAKALGLLDGAYASITLRLHPKGMQVVHQLKQVVVVIIVIVVVGAAVVVQAPPAAAAPA